MTADGNYTFRNNLFPSTGVYGGNLVATARKADMQNRQNYRFTGNIYTDLKFLGDDRLVFRTQFGGTTSSAWNACSSPTTSQSVDGPGKGNVATFNTKTWVWENTLT